MKKILPILLFFIMLFAFIVPSGCSSEDKKYISLSDFANTTIASQTGTLFDEILDNHISGVKHEHYDDIKSQISALSNGDVYAVGLDKPVATFIDKEESALVVFNGGLQTDTYGFAMEKDSAFTDSVSTAISQLSNDGILDELKEKWFSCDEDKMKIDYTEYSGYSTAGGVLRYIHDSTQVPMSYVDDENKSQGYEVEIVLMIGKKLNMEVQITQSKFSELLTAVGSGTFDIASGCITVTDERKESVDFPTSHYQGDKVLLCRKSIFGDGIIELSDLNGKTFGVEPGTIFSAMTAERVENPTILSYNNGADIIQALLSKKIDAFLYDLPRAVSIHNANANISYLEEVIADDNYGYIFAKNSTKSDTIRGQMDNFLNELRTNGTLDELAQKWLGTDESKKTVIPLSQLVATNGTLKLATNNIAEPFSYVSNNQTIGYDIDIITQFCKEYGYGLQIESMDFSSIINAVVSGNCDLGGCSISIT